MLKDKTIILGVSGGIAAYKSAALVSRLKDLGADVWVVMTKEAARLVAPLTFRTLSGNPVLTDLFSEDAARTPVPHIALADRADLLIIAPGTANIIGKIAHGIADDALTTLVMATQARKVIAPAMNCNMWRNPLVGENVAKLKGAGWEFIGPEEGKLACGDYDIGRMTEPEEILARITGWLGGQQDLKGKKFLITAGGTREAIDPVRYISNRSSGKMGYALAEAALRRGAEVTLISGPTHLKPPSGAKHVPVETAREMHEAVMEHKGEQFAIIMAAAVADYRPTVTYWQKVKKSEDILDLSLTRTADILAALGQQKNGSRLVGFAAETNDHIENAHEKLNKKNLDMIVVNDIAAFESDISEIKIINRAGRVEALAPQTKNELADKILDRLLGL
ncbi:MAG: bifunctional phosphopantothenoylcysteine decarboxylase/phosphopantothenate--cysteine ligase CoaBC [Candidatus Saganbacteria bacterium]|nr:bifunctional phosphopantothenoylcysteine decarboxylase/phosphopantothenate--cysteine ligase CoaBC [Candidatus Saganbacteria bacterium]